MAFQVAKAANGRALRIPHDRCPGRFFAFQSPNEPLIIVGDVVGDAERSGAPPRRGVVQCVSSGGSRAGSQRAEDSRCRTTERELPLYTACVFRRAPVREIVASSIMLRKRSVMDMVVLGVVCITAFVVIPRVVVAARAKRGGAWHNAC